MQDVRGESNDALCVPTYFTSEDTAIHRTPHTSQPPPSPPSLTMLPHKLHTLVHHERDVMPTQTTLQCHSVFQRTSKHSSSVALEGGSGRGRGGEGKGRGGRETSPHLSALTSSYHLLSQTVLQLLTYTHMLYSPQTKIHIRYTTQYSTHTP